MAYMQTRGMGEYDRVPNWSWLYNPPPYNFLDAPGTSAPPSFYAPPRTMAMPARLRSSRGMGGCGCGGECGGCGDGHAHGIGALDWGLTSNSLAAQVGFESIPNWVVYAGALAAAAIMKGSFGGGRRR